MTTKNAATSRRKPLLILATAIFIVIGVAYAIWWVIFASGYEDTEDAYVHGNLVQVTSQIPGTVIAIGADDTQTVSKGSLLLELDDSDTRIALQQAEAALAQAVRRTRTVFVQNSALEADIEMQLANIKRAEVDLAKARNDLKRRQTLASSGGVSGEEILHAQTAVKAAESGLAQAKASHAASQAKLQTNLALTAGTSIKAHPDVMQAADQLRKAWLANSRTRLPAPVDGMIAQRSVQVGQHVAPGTPLMTIVPLQQVWVEANFKEGQVQRMQAGQSATLTADMYGSSVVYHGTVQGLAAGTGSAFALLPAQNASGNWIKVVQRIPVRIALDPEELAVHPLRVGLSMHVEVDLSEPEQTDASVMNSGFKTTVFKDNGDGANTLIERIISDNLSS
ncbi:HlyD family efflux transporter periplasmic adaptor subunit [Pollutimonas harenae]|uniref:HlyD family efflux transporter periplasmic adaptor subunit n=1 Tax=Pollutimonas harenae TaxID=657015 RepID=A0A853GUG9_9BURK|nr:HlyD family efflux transporter periplasmic adaptor subunit [Pollutimonas harenae]NYT86828.1 HlyD family efflux transporter periplasmic adaptor subunit [Pollutimonas harenae]TEA71472.1 HlyD family efflux transporter periplasmic adaptor subunit [Pollutimonas harenae]